MAIEKKAKGEVHKLARIAAYALGAIVGLVGANVFNGATASSKYNAWIMIGGGFISMVVAVAVGMVKHDMKGLRGPVSLFFGVLGVVSVIRGIAVMTNQSAQLTAVSRGVF
jgi:hypothetical protein